MQYLIIVDAILTLLEKFLPALKQAFSKGEVTSVEQAALMQRIKNIYAANGGFSGPEWEHSGTPELNVPVDPNKDVIGGRQGKFS